MQLVASEESHGTFIAQMCAMEQYIVARHARRDALCFHLGRTVTIALALEVHGGVHPHGVWAQFAARAAAHHGDVADARIARHASGRVVGAGPDRVEGPAVAKLLAAHAVAAGAAGHCLVRRPIAAIRIRRGRKCAVFLRLDNNLRQQRGMRRAALVRHQTRVHANNTFIIVVPPIARRRLEAGRERREQREERREKREERREKREERRERERRRRRRRRRREREEDIKNITRRKQKK